MLIYSVFFVNNISLCLSPFLASYWPIYSPFEFFLSSVSFSKHVFHKERESKKNHNVPHTRPLKLNVSFLVERQLKQISYYCIPICCIRFWGYIFVALFRNEFRCLLHGSLTNNQKPYFQMKCPLNTVIIVEFESLFSLSLFFRYTWLQPIRDHSRIWLVYIYAFFGWSRFFCWIAVVVLGGGGDRRRT